MKVFEINGNKIEIKLSHFSGMEKIYYNGEIVSQKRTFWGGIHLFKVNENGVDAQYEIKVGLGFLTGAAIIVSRDGVILHNDNN